MAKKKANWITIPEETIHTPVSGKSGKKKEGSSDAVRNKVFWGIGFVVMIIAVFAAIAPTQFNELITGNLFDAEGVGTPISSPKDLLSPDGGAKEKTEEGDVEEESADTAEEPSDETEGDAEAAENLPAQDETAVEEPSDEEGYVAEPVVQPEEEAVTISVNPIVEPEPVEAEPTDTEEPSDGTEDVGTDTGSDEAEPAEDTQAKLIEELNKQLEQLQQQREEDVKVMQELADAAAEDSLKPSATDAEGVPPSVTTTSAIGQPSAVQPGFRVNTHTVSVTPQEMLNQNRAGGYQVAQQPVNTPNYQPAYQVSTPSAVGTPESGPSEVMFIAFLLTFVSLLGWKLIRLSLA